MERNLKIIIIVAVTFVVVSSAIGVGPIQFYFDNTTMHQSRSADWTSVGWVLVGQPCVYDFHIQTDPDRSPYQYEWYFGDGGTVSGTNGTSHVFDRAGAYTVSVVVSNLRGWSETFTIGTTQVFARDSVDCSINEKGVCDWNSTYEGDLFFNVTLWNNAPFSLEFSNYYFGLNNTLGNHIDPVDNQTYLNAYLQPGGNITWTIFFQSDQGTPANLYFMLFSWKVDWKAPTAQA